MKVSLAADKLGCNKTALVGPIFVVAPGLDIILKRNSNYQQHILDTFMKVFLGILREGPPDRPSESVGWPGTSASN